MTSKDPVWITGVGAATPIGNSFTEITRNLLEGKSGVSRVSHFEVTNHPSQIAATLQSIECPKEWSEEDFYCHPKLNQIMLSAVIDALVDADYWHQRDRLRIGLVMGTAAEWILEWETGTLVHGNPLCDPAFDPPSAVLEIQQKLHLSGPATTISAACATGNFALAQARRWLQLGWVDVCLAGACDCAVTPMTLAGFGNLRALTRQNHRPQQASRPFDRDRDGFVLGEGGVIFVLEKASQARRRRARVYGELAGCGLSSDAYHLVIPSPDPTYAVKIVG